jgi:type III pantothenate kinase
MNLCVDIGNSLIKIGYFSDDKCTIFTIETNINNNYETYYNEYKKIQYYQVSKILVSCVVPKLKDIFAKLLYEIYKIGVVFLTCNTSNQFIFLNDDKKEVGGDLLASYIGSLALVDNCIIVDMGTATKISLIKNKAFMGCLILAGYRFQQQNLELKFPHLEISDVPTTNLIGTNTRDSFANGLFYLNYYGIHSIVERLKQENNIDRVILTGGVSICFKNTFKEFEYRPNIVLEGLNILLQ